MIRALCLSAALLAAPFTAQAAGLVPLRNGIYVEAGLSQAEQKAVLTRIRTAQDRMGKLFGQLHANPQWIICKTAACDKQIKLSDRAITYGAILVQIGSKAFTDQTTYTHELTHAQLASALPLVGAETARFPLWVNEGLATLASNSNGAPKGAKPCAGKQASLPANRTAWNKAIRAEGTANVYRAASCAILKANPKRSVAQILQKARAILKAGGSLPNDF